MLSIPATKGFEIGSGKNLGYTELKNINFFSSHFNSGFEGTKLRGSQHNDLFEKNNDKQDPNLSLKANPFNSLKTKTNFAGGTLGGISTGSDIV